MSELESYPGHWAEKTPERKTTTEEKPAERSLLDKLKAGDLDLSVEEVEERIAPSETNVFDK